MESTSWSAPPGAAQPAGIQSTAGAVAVYNEKGDRSMKKVKVQRYVSGKRPEYAPISSDEEVSEDEDFTQPKPAVQAPSSPPSKTLTEVEMKDHRLRRLMSAPVKETSEVDDQDNFVRTIHQAEVVEMGGESDEEQLRRVPESEYFVTGPSHTLAESESESEDDIDEEELALRRQRMREKAIQKIKEEEEMMGDAADRMEQSSEEEEDSEEYSEESDSEAEADGPRLKPVFVRRKDRVTIQQKELLETKQKQSTVESRKRADERRRETLRMIEQSNRAEAHGDAASRNGAAAINSIADVNTDDEADEAEYETWKLRELKRIKRDKEEREAIEKEKEEVEKLRNMTEEERRVQLRMNPKVVTNKSSKGKYKFLQKYYHRGVFFLDKEDEVYKRDFSGATLEDHFDKTILPKVMQVKNFGRSGRTKYTHLVDQDTTSFESPWAADSQINHRFSSTSAGGLKQVFERPSARKKEFQDDSQHKYNGYNQNQSQNSHGYDKSYRR